MVCRYTINQPTVMLLFKVRLINAGVRGTMLSGCVWSQASNWARVATIPTGVASVAPGGIENVAKATTCYL